MSSSAPPLAVPLASGDYKELKQKAASKQSNGAGQGSDGPDLGICGAPRFLHVCSNARKSFHPPCYCLLSARIASVMARA